VDECASGPCLHNGTCLDFVNLFICACAAGYRGAQCQLPVDDGACASGPCLNGASCMPGMRPDDYTCRCAQGFTGLRCDVIVDPCSSQPCANAGTCVSSGGHDYGCQCAPGFSGERCESTHCTQGYCRNGGTCGRQLDVLKCSCVSGFTGARCEQAVSPCASSPCLSGGTCIEPSVGGFSCLCPADRRGVRCDQVIDPGNCQSLRCLNGGTCWCVEGTSTCRCECLPGFTDTTCSTLINACQSLPCLHAGTCFTLASPPGSYACACAAGYTGSRCESAINECESNPCSGSQSSCVDLVARFVCVCDPGFTGIDLAGMQESRVNCRLITTTIVFGFSKTVVRVRLIIWVVCLCLYLCWCISAKRLNGWIGGDK